MDRKEIDQIGKEIEKEADKGDEAYESDVTYNDFTLIKWERWIEFCKKAIGGILYVLLGILASSFVIHCIIALVLYSWFGVEIGKGIDAVKNVFSYLLVISENFSGASWLLPVTVAAIILGKPIVNVLLKKISVTKLMMGISINGAITNGMVTNKLLGGETTGAGTEAAART